MIKCATYFLILLHFLRMLIHRAVSVPLAGHHGGNSSRKDFTCKVAFFYRMKAPKANDDEYILFATVFSLNSSIIQTRFIKFLLKYHFSYSDLCCLDINDDLNTFLENHSVFKQMQINHGTILEYSDWYSIILDIRSRFFSDPQNGTYQWDDISFKTNN